MWIGYMPPMGSGAAPTREGLETLARDYVPDFDGGVRVPGHQDIVLQLHA